MSKYDLIIKSVSFNPQDPDHVLMLVHADKRPNFSGYIRRLIQRDMESHAIKPELEKISGQKALMKGLI